MDFKGLASTLLSRNAELLPEWLPGGKFQGRSYVCSCIQGGKGDSLKVDLNSGKWCDFAATGVSGGDLISLYAEIKGIKNSEAYNELAQRHTIMPLETPTEPPIKITMPPNGTPEPLMIHIKFGAAVMSWCYKTDMGEPMFYVARYEHKGEKKYLPWSWNSIDGKWINKAWNEPRPVYGLEVLAENIDAPVLITEGEKACDAARLFIEGKYQVISWPGGSNATGKVDWSPVKGRKKILLWPDADDAGKNCMNKLAESLYQDGSEIKIIDTTGMNDGWDAADSEFKTFGEFLEWAKPRVKLYTPIVEAELVVEAEMEPPEELKVSELTHPDQSAVTHENIKEHLINAGVNLNAQGHPICNVDNIHRYLTKTSGMKKLIWYDEFHGKYFTSFDCNTPREWNDIDDVMALVHLQRQADFTRITEGMVHAALLMYAHENKRNEAKEWIRSVEWDGKRRIDSFFVDYMGADSNEYTRTASKNWFISMIARIMHPGCQVDNMVILEGAQGAFKTSALRALGGNFYAENHENISTKDFKMVFQGKLIIEISELDSFGQADINTVKKIVTCTSDRFRIPYGRNIQDFPRQCVFVGTTNEDIYLKDNTGARRFWPIKTRRIELDRIKRDRDQLFAEAHSRYMEGETWYEMPDETATHQESRRQQDPWEFIIERWLEGHSEFHDGISSAEIAFHCLEIDLNKIDMKTTRRISKIMRLLKWGQDVKAVDNSTKRVWTKPRC